MYISTLYVYIAPVNDNLAEPFYIAPTRNGDALYQSIDEAQMYEVPITTPESDSQHTYHVLEASRSPQHRGRGEDTANRNVYHTLTPSKQSEMQSEEGHDYHELVIYFTHCIQEVLYLPSVHCRSLVQMMLVMNFMFPVWWGCTVVYVPWCW